MQPRRPLCVLALLLALAVAAAAAAASEPSSRKPKEEYRKEGDVIMLTDDNFDSATATGVWMINIFAPWCSHCMQLAPAYSALATDLKAHNVKVAKVDGMENRVTMKRFGVLGFPTIYLLKDGVTWQYSGLRTLQELKEFALDPAGYKEAARLAVHKAPNSSIGRMLGMVYSIPLYFKRGYNHLREERGLSDTAIIAGVLLLPLTLGAVFICVLDAMYTRRASGGYDDHEHYE